MSQNFSFVDINKIMEKFPEKSDSLSVDCYLTDSPDCSSRVFRLYRNLPKHFHKTSDEILFLLKGEAEFYIEDQDPIPISPGMMVTFYRNTTHMVKIKGDEPVIFLSCDTPKREPDDVHFNNPEEAEGIKFVIHLDKDA